SFAFDPLAPAPQTPSWPNALVHGRESESLRGGRQHSNELNERSRSRVPAFYAKSETARRLRQSFADPRRRHRRCRRRGAVSDVSKDRGPPPGRGKKG